LGRIFTIPLHQDIKEGVIRLPNRIGSLCLPAVNQVESGAVGLLSFMRQSQKPRRYLPHHLIDERHSSEPSSPYPWRSDKSAGISRQLEVAEPPEPSAPLLPHVGVTK